MQLWLLSCPGSSCRGSQAVAGSRAGSGSAGPGTPVGGDAAPASAPAGCAEGPAPFPAVLSGTRGALRGEPALHLTPEPFSPKRMTKRFSMCHCLMCSILTDSSSSVAGEPSSLCFSLLCFTCLGISVLCHLVLQSCCLFYFLAIYLLLISLPLIHTCVWLNFELFLLYARSRHILALSFFYLSI